MRALEVIPREGAIESDWGDQLLDLTLHGDRCLALLWELGETRLYLGAQPTLAVVDSEQPATHSSSTDIGALDLTELIRVIETSEV